MKHQQQQLELAFPGAMDSLSFATPQERALAIQVKLSIVAALDHVDQLSLAAIKPTWSQQEAVHVICRPRAVNICCFRPRGPAIISSYFEATWSEQAAV